MSNEKKKGTYAWIWDFAGEHRPSYVLSILAAVVGVACGLAPYFLTAEVIRLLLSGCMDFGVYLKYIGIISAFWVARFVFHAISTTLSHKATFAVLGNIRKRCCAKLTRVPLGYMLDTPSGSIKNILVERIDSCLLYTSPSPRD